MTTIVYDHKARQIAIDSRYTAGSLICTDEAKKFKTTDDGSIWFFCGIKGDQEKLMNGDNSADCAAILCNKDGSVSIVVVDGDANKVIHSTVDYNYALGSGMEHAWTALDLGCNARESVEMAIKRDLYTGGKVHVYDIELGAFV